MKLHLGCGKRFIPGFYHIDALSYPHVDKVGSVDDLQGINSESISGNPALKTIAFPSPVQACAAVAL